MEGNKAEILKKLMEMKKEFARKQKKLEKSKRTALVKAHVRQKIKEHEDLEKQQTSYSAVDAKEICSAAQAACAGNVACVTKSPAGVEHKDYGSVQSAKMSTEMCLAPSVPSFSHQSVSNFREGFSENGALSDKHLPFSECEKYNKGKNSCEGFEVTNQTQSFQVLEFDENQQKQSTDLSDGSRETKTATSEAAEEECILSKRLYTRKEQREDKSPIKQSSIKSQEPQSSQHNKKNDTQDTGAMSPGKVATKVTSTYSNSMTSEKRESEIRGSKKLSSWMDFDDFKEAVVTPLRPLQCASSRSEKVSVKKCDQDGWLSAVKHKSKSVPYKRKGKYAKLKGNPKSQAAKKTLHTEMSRNEMSKYKEAKNIEKVSKDDVPVPKAISTHVYKGITSPCQLDMNTDKLVNDQEIPNSDVRRKNVTGDVDTISMTVFGRKDNLTCCPKQNGKELGGTASNHVNAETKDFFQSNNVCSDSVTKQPGIPFVKENEATIKDEEKIQNKPQVIGSISRNESDEEIVKASQVSTGRRISGVIVGGRKGLITRTQSSSLSTLSLTPSSTLASDCQEQENVGKEETVTDSQFFNILGVSQNDDGSTYKNCADDVSQGAHLSQFVFSAQKLQSDKVSSCEAETVQGDDSCQQSVKYDSVIVMDSETSCVPEDCPESPLASKVTQKSTCGEEISQDDFSEYTELDAIPYSQFELTEDFLSEDPCQPSSQTNMNINQKFRIRKAGALVKRRSPRTYFHDKGSPRTVGSSHSKPDYDIRKTFMTKHGFKSHPKRSLNQQRKAAAVMSVFQFLVDEAKKPDAGGDFELPSSFEKLKRERLADLNMKPQNSPVHSDTYLENQASKEDSIKSIIKESEPSAVVSELDNREMVVQSHHGTKSEEDNQGLAGVAVQSYVTTICDTQMSEDFVTDGCTLTGTDEEIEEPIAQETTKPSSQAGECRQGKDNAEKVTAVSIIPDSELDVEESIIKSPLPAHEKNQKTLFKSADNITPVSHKRKIRHFSKLGRRLFHTSLDVGMGASKGGNKQSEAGHDCNEGAEVVEDRLLYATATKGEIELSEPSDDFSERHRMSQNKDSSEGSVTKCLSISSKYIRAVSPSATNVATANPSMSTSTYSKHQILTTVGETPNLFESSQNHLSEHEIVPKPKAVHDAHHLHTMSPEISSSQKPTKLCDRNPLHIVINGENSLHRISAVQSPETPVFGTPSPVSSSQASRGGFSFTSTPKTVDTCKADRVISRLDFASPLSRDKSPEDSLIVARSADVNDTTSVSGEMHLSLNINNSPSLVSKSASINTVENHHGDHSSVSNNLSQTLQSEESYVSPAQIPRELSIGNSPLQEILGTEPDDSLFGDKSAMSVISNRVDNSSHGDVRELDGLSGTPLIKPWKKLSKTATTPVQVLEEKQGHSPLGSFIFTPNKRRSRSKPSTQVDNKGCPSNTFKFSGCFQSCSQDAVVSLLNGEVKTDSGSKRYIVSVQATSLTIWTEDYVCGWTTELDWRLSRDVHVMKACLLPREDVILVIASGWERKRYFVSTFVYDINTEDTFRFNISMVEEYKELRSPTDVDLYPHTASELQLGVTTETHHTVGTVLFSDTLKAVQASSTCGLHHGKLVNLVGIKGQATASVSLTADQRITIWNMEIRIAIRKIKLESSLPCLTGLLSATALKGLLLVESLWRIDGSDWGGVLAVNPVNGQVQVAKKYQVPNNTWRRVESAKKESSVVTVVSDRGSLGVWDSTRGTMLGYNKSNITTSACLMKSSRDLIAGEIHGCLHIYSAS